MFNFFNLGMIVNVIRDFIKLQVRFIILFLILFLKGYYRKDIRKFVICYF